MSELDPIPASGMSLRDWFAGQIAAADVCATGANNDRASAALELARRAGVSVAAVTARNAYEIADALLAARDAVLAGEVQS